MKAARHRRSSWSYPKNSMHGNIQKPLLQAMEINMPHPTYSKEQKPIHSLAARNFRSAAAAVSLSLSSMISSATAQAANPFYTTVNTNTALQTLVSAFDAIVTAENVPQTLQPVEAGSLISPAQVALLEKGKVASGIAGARFCEGMLYKNSYVITAASCSDFVLPGQVQVLAGTANANGNGGVLVNVTRITVHPGWNPDTFDNNVAVWRLSTPVAGIATIPLAPTLAATDPPESGYVQSAGWMYSTEGLHYSLPLLRSRLAVTERSQCNRLYGGGITASMMCAGLVTGSTAACAGGYGAPLYRYTSGLNYELIGINSFGITTCIFKGFSTVYTRISNKSIHDFITFNTPSL